MKTTQPKNTILPAWPWWLFTVSSGLFIFDTWLIQSGRTHSFDVNTLLTIHRIVPDQLTDFFLFFTHLGSAIGITVITSALLFGFIRARRYWAGGLLVFSVIGSALCNLLLKALFERMRPDLWHMIITEHGFSFPSGHAMAASGLIFILLYLTWQTRWRQWILVVGLPFLILVSFSRLFLGVHFPSDILGGWLFSLAWVGLIAGLVHLIRLRRHLDNTL